MTESEKLLPFEQRRLLAAERVQHVLKALDVDLAPIIHTSPMTFQAQLVYVDLQNDRMLMDLGLVKPTGVGGSKTVMN